MTNLENHITKAIDGLTDEECDKLILAVQKYAEYYAQKCLEKAADKADILGGLDEGFRVNRNSITSITFPDHE